MRELLTNAAVAVIVSAVIAGIVALVNNRSTLRRNQSKTDAEAFAAGSNAQNETIGRLSAENTRLSTKVEQQDKRITELERRLDIQDGRERIILHHVSLSDEWMERAAEGKIQGPVPKLVLDDQT